MELETLRLLKYWEIKMNPKEAEDVYPEMLAENQVMFLRPRLEGVSRSNIERLLPTGQNSESGKVFPSMDIVFWQIQTLISGTSISSSFFIFKCIDKQIDSRLTGCINWVCIYWFFL
jgi:hypothetical protein